MKLVEMLEQIHAISLDDVLRKIKPTLTGIDLQDRADALSAIRKVAVYYEGQLPTFLPSEQAEAENVWRYRADRTYIWPNVRRFGRSDQSSLESCLDCNGIHYRHRGYATYCIQ